MVQQNVAAIKTDLQLLVTLQSCGKAPAGSYKNLLLVLCRFLASRVPHLVFWLERPQDCSAGWWAHTGIWTLCGTPAFPSLRSESFKHGTKHSRRHIGDVISCLLHRWFVIPLQLNVTHLSLNEPPPERKPHSRGGQSSLATDTGPWRSRESQ